MRREEFIKTGCSICIGLMAGVSLISLMDSCASGKILKKTIVSNSILVEESDFEANSSFVIIRTPSLNYDVLLNKTSDKTFTAVLMQCTHYDNPLYANKTQLFCPSHGSTFDFTGKVTKEPAINNLKQYKTNYSNNQITIYLS